KAVSAVAWQAEQTTRVNVPPARSEKAPQSWRLRNPLPRTTDSMAAPWDGAMPRSEQNATKCACGRAIGMQHRNAAAHNNPKTRAGGQPVTFPAPGLANLPAYLRGISGGARRKTAASGMIMAT